MTAVVLKTASYKKKLLGQRAYRFTRQLKNYKAKPIVQYIVQLERTDTQRAKRELKRERLARQQAERALEVEVQAKNDALRKVFYINQETKSYAKQTAFALHQKEAAYKAVRRLEKELEFAKKSVAALSNAQEIAETKNSRNEKDIAELAKRKLKDTWVRTKDPTLHKKFHQCGRSPPKRLKEVWG